MTSNEFEIIVNETVLAVRRLMQSKGSEYAGSDDRLANFKRGSSLTGVQPLTVLFIYLSKHYDAVSTYVRKNQLAPGAEQVLSEPIEGRLDDIINYCILAKALIKEQGNAKSPAELHRDLLSNVAGLSDRPSSTDLARAIVRGGDKPVAGHRRYDDVHSDKPRA